MAASGEWLQGGGQGEEKSGEEGIEERGKSEGSD